MADWCCYLIRCLDNNQTYIGATNNFPKRLATHNRGKGAKATKGRTWIPVVTVGFFDKRSCLSFESGWKRLCRRRTADRLIGLTSQSRHVGYNDDPAWNRIMDLLYFTHNTTFIGTKFMINYDDRHPLFTTFYTVTWYFEPIVRKLPWPYFVSLSKA